MPPLCIYYLYYEQYVKLQKPIISQVFMKVQRSCYDSTQSLEVWYSVISLVEKL